MKERYRGDVGKVGSMSEHARVRLACIAAGIIAAMSLGVTGCAAPATPSVGRDASPKFADGIRLDEGAVGSETGAVGPDTATKTIPFFKTAFAYAGKTYQLKIVGTNPASGGATTTVPDQIIPIKLVFSDGTVLDGSTEVPTLTASPVFVNASYPSGKTQFGDGLMRAEFWKYAKSESYHVLVGKPTVLSTMRISVPAADGSIVNGEGRVSYQWFIQTIEPQILTGSNIDPSSFSIFLTKNTRVLEPSGHCCFNGYHSAFDITLPSGPATFTTAWASVSTGSVTHMAHEVAEWMNDPFYTNVVPKWETPMTNSCGGSKLEVGDPLAGTIYTVNGYQVEDMTFYSWFAHDMQSIGINGQYDMRAVLTGPATVCL